MAYLNLSYKHTRKPNHSVPVDKSNPLSKGLLHQSLFNQTFSDLSNITPIVGTGATKKVTRDGRSYHLDGTANGNLDFGDASFQDNSIGLTFELIFTLDDLSSEKKMVAKWGGDGSTQSLLLSILASGAIQVAYYNSTDAFIIGATAGSVITANKRYHIICEAMGANWKFWANGVLYNVTGDAAPTVVLNNTANSLYVGRDDSGGYVTGDISLVRFYDHTRTFKQGEVNELYTNPYQLLQPISQNINIDGSASDITAPVLSSPTGTKTGSTTASGTVSTDEGNGTLYFIATTNATETAATIKAGSSQSVTATGSQAVTFTGLTASTTYYAHYVQDDAASNESNVVVSASFTTDAASSFNIVWAIQQSSMIGAR